MQRPHLSHSPKKVRRASSFCAFDIAVSSGSNARSSTSGAGVAKVDLGLLPISSQSFSFDEPAFGGGAGAGAAGFTTWAVRSAGLRPGVGVGCATGAGAGVGLAGGAAACSGLAGAVGRAGAEGLVGSGRPPLRALAAFSRRLARHRACRSSKGSRSSGLAAGAPGSVNPWR